MKQNFKRLLSALLVCALITAMALCTVSCNNNTTDPTEPTPATTGQTGATEEKGETFTLEVTFPDGTTARETYAIEAGVDLGTILEDKGVIAGDKSEYGLYVKTVMGKTVDYDIDKMYWALYVNGEKAMTGISSIMPEAGAVYALKAQK